VELVANLHVHTTFSDGSGTMEQVIGAARECLDVLLINDHDGLEGLYRGYDGYQGRLLVIVGLELSGPHNHYLVYGLSRVPEYQWKEPQAFIDHVRAEGGKGFIAHPFEQGSPMSEGGRAYTWEDWSAQGFDGLEIWNHSSAWKIKARGVLSALFHFVFRTATLSGPDRPTLALWDDLGRTRRVAGVGGSDAHALMHPLGPFTFCIFPYPFMFRSINTHVLLKEPLTGNAAEDRVRVVEALASGSCFVAHDRLGSARGFDFWLENGSQVRAGQGEEVHLEPGDRLAWRLPRLSPARLIRDGRVIWTGLTLEGLLPAEGPGVYRLEVDRRRGLFGPRPWIFSNPVYVRS
jgi:hypothetical protein